MRSSRCAMWIIGSRNIEYLHSGLRRRNRFSRLGDLGISGNRGPCDPFGAGKGLSGLSESMRKSTLSKKDPLNYARSMSA